MTTIHYLDDLEIEEPIGFGELEVSIKRDDIFHGMTYEASTSSLQFYGEAAAYLKEQKELNGVKANVIYRALMLCEDYDYDEVISGRLNFGKYREHCGNACSVSIPLEQQSCAVILNARKDQKVDVDKDTGVDNTTFLGVYDGLGVETELPAHEIFTGIDANVAPEGYTINTGETGLFVSAGILFRPMYAVIRNNSIDTSNIEFGTDAGATQPLGILPEAISPQLLLEDNAGCFTGVFDYEIRLKGNYSYTVVDGSGGTDDVKIRLFKGTWPDSVTVIDEISLPSFGSQPRLFDESFSGSTTLANEQGLYAVLELHFVGSPGNINVDITTVFDTESSFLLTTTKVCPATDAKLYLIHETLSRVSEAITNGCTRVKSSFYGRTDSQPFAFDADGCGGLRSVTSGLKIRRAEEDKFFTSLKDLLEGLNAIDNIGFDIIQDPDISYGTLLRIEGVDFFYENAEILRHDAIPDAETEVEEGKHYSRVQVGYKKWEVERVNGLDEFNSTREYNTSIETVNANLDITSVLVAGTYPIEITRQQSFAQTGRADTKYDNDTFLICLERSVYPYTGLQVELGNINNQANIFSPDTIYNYRLSPARNLMRWYKTIAAAFPNLGDSANALFFTSGTGNLIASGLMEDTFCRLENSDVQENENIFVTKFANPSDYTPLWKNELITYEYPMSIADYRAVKENPYGYISAQCGNGDFKKYWIKEIKYKPMIGTATITGRLKYGS